MLAYPGIVFVIFFVTIFGPTFRSISLAIGLYILVPGTIGSCVARRSALNINSSSKPHCLLASSPFASWCATSSPTYASPIIVIASVQIGVAILIEAAISFLGLGVSSATSPSWGRMLQETRPSGRRPGGRWSFPAPPSAFAVVAFNMFGDALRDWLDPRLRGSR